MSDLVDRTIYLHTARPEWGGAIVAWERDGKRGYQFEDGRLRVFAAGHYHLLEPIDGSADRRRTLRALVGLPVEGESTRASAAPSPRAELPSLEEQVAHFAAAYPGGFAGEAWRAERRGGSGRTRKRHRDPVVALARQELTPERLAACVERGRDDEGLAILAGVLAKTDLVPWAHVQPLPELPPNRARAVLVGLFDLLFARSSVEVRIVQWVQALTRGAGKRPSWALATAPLALLMPEHHVCVHRASFVAQGSSFGLGRRVSSAPSGMDYAPLLAMAGRVRDRLSELDCPPADLLDVHDFMVFTLSAGAARTIAGRR